MRTTRRLRRIEGRTARFTPSASRAGGFHAPRCRRTRASTAPRSSSTCKTGRSSRRRRLLGRHNLYNVLAAASLASFMGVPAIALGRAIEGFEPYKGRFKPVRSGRRLRHRRRHVQREPRLDGMGRKDAVRAPLHRQEGSHPRGYAGAWRQVRKAITAG